MSDVIDGRFVVGAPMTHEFGIIRSVHHFENMYPPGDAIVSVSRWLNRTLNHSVDRLL